jgi:Sel1 repeat protein
VQTEAEHLSTLADQGDAAAQNELGVSYFEGQIVPRDDTQAFLWIGRAARQGLPEAQTNLAHLYEQGRGTAKNTEQAVYWYSRAAEQGYPAAAQRLNELRSAAPVAPAVPEGSKDSLDALF